MTRALTLHTFRAGDPANPAIVLLHGFSMSHAIFAPLITALQDRFFLVAPDLRGHGLSPKPQNAYGDSADWAADIDKIIKPLNRPLLLGWSMGGRAVMDYMRHYGPDAVSAIAVIGSYTGPVPEATKANRGPMFDQSARTVGTQTFVRACTHDPLPDDFTETLVEQALLCPHHVRQSLADRDEDYTRTAQSLNIPALVLHGDADKIVPPAASAAHHFPNATHLIYEGSGHTPFVEDTPRFATDLANFAQKALT